MARRVPPGVVYMQGPTTATCSVQPYGGCVTITAECNPITYAHMGYVHHDWILTRGFPLNEMESFFIMARDIPEPVNDCFFEVRAERELIGDEYTDTDTEEIAHYQTQAEAEAAFVAMVEKYRVIAERERKDTSL